MQNRVELHQDCVRAKFERRLTTSVETVDAFNGEELKLGKGTSDWRRFFQLVATVHARLEKTADVPNTPKEDAKLLHEVKCLEQKLDVIRNLRAYARITSHITRQKKGESRDWYLLRMLPDEHRVTVKGYGLQEFDQAKRALAESEQEYQGTKNQAALVSTSSLNELRKVYPNYFADTAHFTSALERFLNKT